MNATHEGRQAQRGQILVLFTVALIVVIAMLGLVLDGGSTFAQRRDQQNVADLASFSGADAYLNATANKSAAADAAARALALSNGYTTNVATGESVDVVVTDYSTFANVTVTVTRPHVNNFAGLLGMPTWGVSAKATSTASRFPNGAKGAMPLLFNAKAFPGAVCNPAIENCGNKIEVYQLPGTGPQDVPQDATQFNWTIFCEANGNACNANSSGVRAIIDGNGANACEPGGITRSPCTIFVGDAIGPLNAGNHTTLFTALAAHVGETFPVPIVNDSGQMVGWAMFHLVSSEGASDKVIKGWFESPYNSSQLVVGNGGSATLETGVYVLKLID